MESSLVQLQVYHLKIRKLKLFLNPEVIILADIYENKVCGFFHLSSSLRFKLFTLNNLILNLQQSYFKDKRKFACDYMVCN